MNVNLVDAERSADLEKEFFRSRIDGNSVGFEGQVGELVVDEARIRRQLIDAYIGEAIVELFFPGGQRIFLCRLIEQDETMLSEYEQEYGTTLCRLTGMDAQEKQLPSLVISPLEPSKGNMEIMKVNGIVLRIFQGKNAEEFGTYFLGRTMVNGCQALALKMPVVSRTIKNIRAFRVNLTGETRFPIRISLANSSVEVTCEAFNLSAEGIAFSIPDQLQKILDRESVINVTLNPVQSPAISNVPAVIRHRSKVRNADTVQEMCGAQFMFPTAAVASSLGGLAASLQRNQIRYNRLYKKTSFAF